MQAWEFKHPEFRADRKDNLDNIRRKAPSAKGKMAGDETNLPMAQQITLLNEQVTATQQQVQELQESYAELSQTNKLFIAEIMNLQKMVRAQGQVQREILNYLDDRRRNVQLAPAPAFNTQGVNMLTDSADDVAELRRAREIMNGIPLSDMSAAERELERLLAAYQTASPPDSVGSSAMFGAAPHHGGGGGPPHQHHGGPSGPGPVTLGLPHDPINDMRHLVYPVGQNNGIDPFHPDHIAHIPYSRPIANPTPLATDGPNAGGQLMAGPSRSQQQQRSAPHWATRKPRVLLVEDDAVCSKIGAKFLTQMDCIVEVAVGGTYPNMVHP